MPQYQGFKLRASKWNKLLDFIADDRKLVDKITIDEHRRLIMHKNGSMVTLTVLDDAQPTEAAIDLEVQS